MKKFLFSLIAFCCLSPLAHSQNVNIIPQPVKLTVEKGEFKLKSSTPIHFADGAEEYAAYLQETFLNSTNFELQTKKVKSNAKPKKNAITLVVDSKLVVGKDGYILDVKPEGVVITGADKGGLFYGIQTLLQLFQDDVYSKSPIRNKEWSAQAVQIEDAPKHSWRGMMLDVARYFYDKEFVKKYIDMMAMYKMNRLQFHLIDDSGWRLEIKKYPLLTDVGAWAGEDTHRLGGFYTQEDIKEIVEYAALRNVEVVPEIEFPAHMLSAVVAYPWLSCDGENKKLEVPSKHFISRDLLCLGKDTSYKFLEEVLAETVALFPSKYIHIGGDEAVYTEWEKCAHCQAVREREGLKETSELQGYLTNVVADMMKKYDRMIVGWEEVAQRGKLNNQLVSVIWRDLKNTKHATDLGHYTVLAPASHTYFDFAESKTPGEIKAATWMPPISVEKCYSLMTDPYNTGSLVLGVQGCYWSDQFIHGTTLQEFDVLDENRSENYAQYLTFPRLLALSEVAWSVESKRDFKDFSNRLKYHYAKLDSKECIYRVPEPIVADITEQNGKYIFTLEPSVVNSSIRYTTNGTYPYPHSDVYVGKVTVDDKTQFRAVTVINENRISLPTYITDKYSEYKKFGELIAKWNPESLKVGEFTPFKIDATGKISGNGTYEITFIYTGGTYKLEIEGVKIFKRDELIGEDMHAGSTGGAHLNNTYKINVDGFEAGTPFSIEALIRGDLGNDSNGYVFIKKID